MTSDDSSMHQSASVHTKSMSLLEMNEMQHSAFSHESNEEVTSLPCVDNNTVYRSCSSVTEEYPSLGSESINNSKNTNKPFELSEETDDFFFLDIEEMVPIKNCDGSGSSPCSSMTIGPLHKARSAMNLQKNVSSSSDMNKSSSLRRCNSQSILKTSSSYMISDGYERSSDSVKLKPSTSFSTLEIREYPITLGDNPGGAQGPPISLDWKYNKKHTQVVPLEDYEETRPRRRNRKEMHIPGNMRRWRLLRKEGVSVKEIENAIKAADAVRRQRRKSVALRPGHLSSLKRRIGNLVSSIKSPR